MQRRRYLALGLVGLGTAIAGCTGDDGDSFTATEPDSGRITGEEPTLASGESAQLRITAAEVTKLQLGVPFDEPAVDFSIRAEHVTPSPDQRLESYPPEWRWDQCTDVEAEIPVAVADDADPGEYTYSVTVTACEENNVEREFTVTVAID